jgi:hypothetical protein
MDRAKKRRQPKGTQTPDTNNKSSGRRMTSQLQEEQDQATKTEEDKLEAPHRLQREPGRRRIVHKINKEAKTRTKEGTTFPRSGSQQPMNLEGEETKHTRRGNIKNPELEANPDGKSASNQAGGDKHEKQKAGAPPKDSQ